MGNFTVVLSGVFLLGLLSTPLKASTGVSIAPKRGWTGKEIADLRKEDGQIQKLRREVVKDRLKLETTILSQTERSFMRDVIGKDLAEIKDYRDDVVVDVNGLRAHWASLTRPQRELVRFQSDKP